MNLLPFNKDFSRILFLNSQPLKPPLLQVSCATFLLPQDRLPGYTSVSISPWCLLVLPDCGKPEHPFSH